MIFSSFKDTSNNATSNTNQSSSGRAPKKNRGKPLKRLNPKMRSVSSNKGPRQSPRSVQQNKPKKDFQNDLAEFIALRHTNGDPSNSAQISAVPSQELLWVRDGTDTTLQPLPTDPQFISVDDEIEDGEIVESDITGIVDLLQESFAAVKKSQTIIDLSSPEKSPMFYEERLPTSHGAVPKYKAYGADKSAVNDTSDCEVICLDSSQPDADDSVIFVGEIAPLKVPALATPDCLKSPCINNLLNLTKPRKVSPKRKMRLQLWKEKKAIEYAEINAATGKTGKTGKSGKVAKIIPPKLEAFEPFKPPEPVVAAPANGREKRIVLIDGSNLAMSFTDNYGAKKTDKDFSAEGELRISILRNLQAHYFPQQV